MGGDERQDMGEIDIWGSSGVLDVLQIGRGHLRMTIEEGNGVDVDRAKRVIEDMMRRGYAIFVEDPDGSTHRVLEFDPERFVYVIDDTMAAVPATGPMIGAAPDEVAAAPVPRPPRARRATKAVGVGTAKATAVGRSAGG